MARAAKDRLNGNACERCGVFLFEGDKVVLGSPENEEVVEYDEEEHRNIGFPIYHKECTDS